jgi:Ca-activated chloride channel homolog
MSLLHPGFLWLLLLLPLLIWLHYSGRMYRSATVRFSSTAGMKKIARGARVYLRHSVFALRLLALVLILFAVAGPVSTTELENLYAEGVDIVIALDVSMSMRATDLAPRQRHSRLDVAKVTAKHFVEGRKHDRIGLQIFGKDSFTQCPMTLDYSVLNTILDEVALEEELGSATAIGMGLAGSVNMLKHGQAKSRVVILLTDGVNNTGQIDPLTAAKMAKAMEIKVYTIGVGTDGAGGFFAMRGPQIDEKTLKEIAKTTGGNYFRVKDSNTLKKTFEKIDELEKTEIESKTYRRHSEKFAGFAISALLCLLLEMVLSNTVLRRLP